MSRLAQCWICFKPVDTNELGNIIACHFCCRPSLENERDEGFRSGIEASAALVEPHYPLLAAEIRSLSVMKE